METCDCGSGKERQRHPLRYPSGDFCAFVCDDCEGDDLTVLRKRQENSDSRRWEASKARQHAETVEALRRAGVQVDGPWPSGTMQGSTTTSPSFSEEVKSASYKEPLPSGAKIDYVGGHGGVTKLKPPGTTPTASTPNRDAIVPIGKVLQEEIRPDNKIRTKFYFWAIFAVFIVFVYITAGGLSGKEYEALRLSGTLGLSLIAAYFGYYFSSGESVMLKLIPAFFGFCLGLSLGGALLYMGVETTGGYDPPPGGTGEAGFCYRGVCE